MDAVKKWKQKKPDERLLKELIESRNIHLMFAGEICSEKECQFLLEILRVFRLNYNEKVTLRIIADLTEGLAEHESFLRRKISAYHLRDCIEFVNKPGDSQLMSYYLGSDMMLCTGSSGETDLSADLFTEARFFSLPVLAWGKERISDKVRHIPLIMEERPELFAAAIHILTENRKYAEYLSAHGQWEKRS